MLDRIKVTLRSNGKVAWTAPTLRIRREWSPNNREQYPSAEEIRDVYFSPGGRDLINDFLIIHDEEIRTELAMPTDIEYTLTLEEIKTVIADGSPAEVKDLLTYSPEGARQVALDMATAGQIDSAEKINIIGKILGKDIPQIIKLKKSAEDESETTESTTKDDTPAPARKYSIVKK
jgi:hypothetical protein